MSWFDFFLLSSFFSLSFFLRLVFVLFWLGNKGHVWDMGKRNLSERMECGVTGLHSQLFPGLCIETAGLPAGGQKRNFLSSSIEKHGWTGTLLFINQYVHTCMRQSL